MVLFLSRRQRRRDHETMAMASPYQPQQCYHRSHESEWIYSSPISRRFFTPMNDYMHQRLSLASSSSTTSSLSLWNWWCRPFQFLELYIAMCGYAFNPVMFPIWPLFIFTVSYGRCSSLTNSIPLATESTRTNIIDWKRWKLLWHHLDQQHAVAVRHTALYLASVVVTLTFTEIGKTMFSTSRPNPSYLNDGCWKTPRKYETLVASLKSKHSFPSGDCAQAMNFGMIVCKFLMSCTASISTLSSSSSSDILSSQCMINLLLFGIFLPSVAFARVYFRCHWIEDCIGGIALSWILHMTIIPEIAQQILS